MGFVHQKVTTLLCIAALAGNAWADHQVASNRGKPDIDNPAIQFQDLTEPPQATVHDQNAGRKPTFAIMLNEARLGGNKPHTDTGTYAFRMPSPYGYQNNFQNMLDDPDNFIRSNIDNRQNNRDTATEIPQDMTPCRQESTLKTPMNLVEGETVNFPSRWNNPHNSECEVNFWIPSDNSTTGYKVMTVRRQFPAGGGYQSAVYPFTVPTGQNLTTLCAAGSECFMQMYCHSVETRTYTVCTDITVSPSKDAAKTVPLQRRARTRHVHTRRIRKMTRTRARGQKTVSVMVPVQAVKLATERTDAECPAFTPDPTLAALQVTGDNPQPNVTTKEFNQFPCGTEQDYTLKDAMLYSDSFDTSHKDSQFSMYRGQNPCCVSLQMNAILTLKSYISNGGLGGLKNPIDLGNQNKRNNLKDEVQNLINNAEDKAREANKKAQRLMGQDNCFEANDFGITNETHCEDRQFTTTYVSRVNYLNIVNKLQSQNKFDGMVAYNATRKDTMDTPYDADGMRGGISLAKWQNSKQKTFDQMAVVYRQQKKAEAERLAKEKAEKKDETTATATTTTTTTTTTLAMTTTTTSAVETTTSVAVDAETAVSSGVTASAVQSSDASSATPLDQSTSLVSDTAVATGAYPAMPSIGATASEPVSGTAVATETGTASSSATVDAASTSASDAAPSTGTYEMPILTPTATSSSNIASTAASDASSVASMATQAAAAASSVDSAMSTPSSPDAPISTTATATSAAPAASTTSVSVLAETASAPASVPAISSAAGSVTTTKGAYDRNGRFRGKLRTTAASMPGSAAATETVAAVATSSTGVSVAAENVAIATAPVPTSSTSVSVLAETAPTSTVAAATDATTTKKGAYDRNGRFRGKAQTSDAPPAPTEVVAAASTASVIAPSITAPAATGAMTAAAANAQTTASAVGGDDERKEHGGGRKDKSAPAPAPPTDAPTPPVEKKDKEPAVTKAVDKPVEPTPPAPASVPTPEAKPSPPAPAYPNAKFQKDFGQKKDDAPSTPTANSEEKKDDTKSEPTDSPKSKPEPAAPSPASPPPAPSPVEKEDKPTDALKPSPPAAPSPIEKKDKPADEPKSKPEPAAPSPAPAPAPEKKDDKPAADPPKTDSKPADNEKKDAPAPTPAAAPAENKDKEGDKDASK